MTDNNDDHQDDKVTYSYEEYKQDPEKVFREADKGKLVVVYGRDGQTPRLTLSSGASANCCDDDDLKDEEEHQSRTEWVDLNLWDDPIYDSMKETARRLNEEENMNNKTLENKVKTLENEVNELKKQVQVLSEKLAKKGDPPPDPEFFDQIYSEVFGVGEVFGVDGQG